VHGGGSEAPTGGDPLSWGDLYGLIITATGWTPRQVDATPWPDVLDLLSYWRHHPPIHILAHGFLGGGSKGSKGDAIDNATPEQLAAGIAGL
jgi:hypothetical protein